MKRFLKKNPVIITALAIMIAAAGYLSYSDSFFEKDATKEVDSELAEMELLDISEEDLKEPGDIAQLDEGEVPGEAILTNGNISSIVAQAKVNREQVRAKNKETLQSIIDDTQVSDAQKTDAITKMVAMTEIADKEVAIETLLASKGFTDAVVSLTEKSADVIVGGSDLSDAKRAQIEDIVVRKADIAASDIVITPIYQESKATESEKE